MSCRILQVALALTAVLATAHAGRAQDPQDPQVRFWEAAIAGDTVEMAAALDAGASRDSLDTRRSRNGRRALNYAALYNRVDAIQFLLARGADIQAANNTGFTPLHHAAEAGSLDAARALLEAGADPNQLNVQGETPAEVARREGQPAVAELIEAAAAARFEPPT